MKKPNFFVVGKPKTGTTALYHMIKDHPEIFLPEQKQLYHFGKDLLDELLSLKKYNNKYYKTYYCYEIDDYLKHFESVANEKFIGDITPNYLDSAVAAEEIFKFNKNSKIIAFFREPADFLFSCHSQLLYSNHESERNFEKALKLEEKRKEMKRNNIKYDAPFSLLFYSEKIKYTEQLDRFLKRFGKENVKVLIYDFFKKDNAAIIKEIFEFLDIDSSFQPIVGNHNVRKDTRINIVRKLSTSKLGLVVARTLPQRQVKNIGRIINKLTTKKSKNVVLSENTKKELKRKYRNEVIEFSYYLKDNSLMNDNIDLIKLWGYDES